MSKLLLTANPQGTFIYPNSFDDPIVKNYPEIKLKSQGLINPNSNHRLFAFELGDLTAIELPHVFEPILESLKTAHQAKYDTKFSDFEVIHWEFITESNQGRTMSHRINILTLDNIAEMNYNFICQYVDVLQIKNDLCKCGFSLESPTKYRFYHKQMKIHAMITLQQNGNPALFELYIGDINSDKEPSDEVRVYTKAFNVININQFLDLIVETIKYQKRQYLDKNFQQMNQ